MSTLPPGVPSLPLSEVFYKFVDSLLQEEDDKVESLYEIIKNSEGHDATEFNYGVRPGGEFQESIRGVEATNLAKGVFGNQLQAIFDIIFEEAHYYSEEWKSNTLLNLFNIRRTEINPADPMFSILVVQRFNEFLRNTKKYSPTQMAELHKQCDKRIDFLSLDINANQHTESGEKKRNSRTTTSWFKISKASGTPTRKESRALHLSAQNGQNISHNKSKSDSDGIECDSEDGNDHRASNGELAKRRRSLGMWNNKTGSLKTSQLVLLKPIHSEPVPHPSWDDVEPTNTEKLTLITPVEGYHVECGKLYSNPEWDFVTTHYDVYCMYEDTLLYSDKISTKIHHNYLCTTEPCLVSVSEEKGCPFLIIIHTVQKTMRLCAPPDVKLRDVMKAVKNIISDSGTAQLVKIRDPAVVESLKKFERNHRVNSYKFGILYCCAGQTDENAMFSNNNPSTHYKAFLDFIGERIKLKGWTGFRGGLDVNSDTTGTESIFTSLQGYSIMFHVSTLLPHVPSDEQKLERKRHLGNDVVLIVYKEGDQKFDPTCIRSEFNHIFLVVQKVPKEKEINNLPTYKVEIAYKGDIPHPPYPLLPADGLFNLNTNFKKFLLSKMINGERITMSASRFITKLERTRRILINDIVNDYGTKVKKDLRSSSSFGTC